MSKIRTQINLPKSWFLEYKMHFDLESLNAPIDYICDEFLKNKMEDELHVKNKTGSKYYWQYVRVEHVHDLDSHDSRLHKWASEAEELNKKAKISDQFLYKETKDLIKATEKFIQAIQRAGI